MFLNNKISREFARKVVIASLSVFLSTSVSAKLVFVTEENAINEDNFIINADDSVVGNFVDLDFGTALGQLRYDSLNDKFNLNRGIDIDGITKIKSATASNYIAIDGGTSGGNLATITSRGNGITIATGTDFGNPHIKLMPGTGGNVGIGDANPDEKLVVDGNVKLTDKTPTLFFNTKGNEFFRWNNSTKLQFGMNGNLVADITRISSDSASFQPKQFATGESAGSNPAFSFQQDTDTGMYLHGKNKVGLTTGGVGRLIVDADGDVGIGVATTDEKLEVNGNIKVGDILNIGGSTGNAGELEFFNSVVRLKRTASSGLDFYTDGGAPHLQIANNGNINTEGNSLFVDNVNQRVGIGDDTPDALLDVAGSFRLDGTFSDKDGDVGTSGQVLSSTATGTDWITSPGISSTDSETFTIDNDNTGGDVALVFGQTLNERLTWNSANSRFDLSDSLNVFENLTVGGDTETIDDTSFVLNGDDAFIADSLGVEGAIYTDDTATKYQFIEMHGCALTSASVGTVAGGKSPVVLFDKNGDSAMACSFPVPDDWVSGTDINLDVFYSASNNNAGDVDFDLEYASFGIGDTINSAPFTDTIPGANYTTISASSQTVLAKLTEDIPAASLNTNEMVNFRLSRSPGDPGDNYNGNINIHSIRISYTGKKLH